ncbi:hypothetical protein MNBD_GAMMA22-861 [hydrothermal vent metagenome]|uniref:HMA domain-containing protein n=1 Tax=hydrothermal vent metagenome TaxID=652676 RepID=A0A3B0ZWI1_9ZZZZ
MKKILILLLAVYSSIIQATESSYPHIYQGKVKGMVCAFCVYNVSKKIASLPEIKAETVNVDLKSKIVNFRSSSKVSFDKLAKVFSDSGFNLTELNEVKKMTLKIPPYKKTPVLKFTLDNLNVDNYITVFESIGEIAAASKGKLEIKAPESVEVAILKPMIAGKQKIARVQYSFEKTKKSIEVKLFLRDSLE